MAQLGLSFPPEKGPPTPSVERQPSGDGQVRQDALPEGGRSYRRSRTGVPTSIESHPLGRDSDARPDGSDDPLLHHDPPSETVGGVSDPSSLASAFGVDFAVTPGTTYVALDDAGHVVSGHLEVFAARSAGRMVRTASQAFDPERLHAAAVVEHDHCRTVGKAVSRLCGHATRLGIEAGKSRTAIAQGLRVSRSLVSRSAAVTALMAKHPDSALRKSHFEAVLSLEEPEQGRFLEEAAQRGLSVRELEDLVATAHPERRRQRRGEETLAELMEVAGLADRLGDSWKQDRRGCVAAERRFLRLIHDRAAHLLPVPRGTDAAGWS
jgi:hypothetical protein